MRQERGRHAIKTGRKKVVAKVSLLFSTLFLLVLFSALTLRSFWISQKQLTVYVTPPLRARVEKAVNLFQHTHPQFTVTLAELPVPDGQAAWASGHSGSESNRAAGSQSGGSMNLSRPGGQPATQSEGATALVVDYLQPGQDHEKEKIIFYDYQLLAVPFLEPIPGLSRAEAVALLAQGGAVRSRPFLRPDELSRTPAWSARKVLTEEEYLRQGRLASDEVALLTWPNVNLSLKVLPIDGHYPWPHTIEQGTYPLSFPVTSTAFTNRGNWLASLLDRLLTPLSPPGAAAAFQEFLRGPKARGIFYPGREGFSLTAVGDLMLDRGVAAKIASQGLTYPLSLTAQRLAAADLTLANLESPLGVKGKPLPKKGIWFRAKPETVAILNQGGIDAVTLANNHILDYDTDNLLETMDLLSAHHISFTGAGRNLEEARRPLILKVKVPDTSTVGPNNQGQRASGIGSQTGTPSKGYLQVAFLGYSDFAEIFWSYQYRRTFSAGPNLPGVAPIKENYLREDIARARREADLVVVAFHWGQEYTNVPVKYQSDQRAVAHLAIDAGADLVLGFHPHAIQGLELYKGRLIAYSLGNFVMDQKSEITRESMILECWVDNSGIKTVNLVPTMIEECRPRVLEGQEGLPLLEKFRRISQGLK